MEMPGKDSKKVVIFSKEYCPYCVRAKALFDDLKVPYDEIDLTDKMDSLDDLKRKTGHMTVPQIFVGDKFVGGYSDLKQIADSGELTKLLKDKKIIVP